MTRIYLLISGGLGVSLAAAVGLFLLGGPLGMLGGTVLSVVTLALAAALAGLARDPAARAAALARTARVSGVDVAARTSPAGSSAQTAAPDVDPGATPAEPEQGYTSGNRAARRAAARRR